MFEESNVEFSVVIKKKHVLIFKGRLRYEIGNPVGSHYLQGSCDISIAQSSGCI